MVNWDRSDGFLRCCSCGTTIQLWLERFGGWREAEEKAGARLLSGAHVCTATPNALEKVKVAMKRYRAADPDINFEDQMKVYNFLMRNQTYLDEL